MPRLGLRHALGHVMHVRLQEGMRKIHTIPPGPMLRHMNEQLAEFFEHGVQVLDTPHIGPPQLIVVHPKVILRIADYPGAHVCVLVYC